MKGRILEGGRAEFTSNVSEFIGFGQGRVMDKFEIMHLKFQHPTFDSWIESLPIKSKERILRYLEDKYGHD